MSEKMTVWGIGPIFAIISILYFLAVVFINFRYPQYFVIKNMPYSVFIIIGIILLLIGIPLWIVSAKSILTGFKEGRLLIEGVYSIVRHPLYSAFIVFIVPGIVMFFRSWILFTVPIVMYITFKILIKKEEHYLEQKFGQLYLDYKSTVNAVFPCLRFWK